MDDAEQEERQKAEEALIEQGLAAKAILDSPAFLSTVNRLAATFSENLFATRPEESAVRERFYHHAVGLQAIVDMLMQDASAAAEIIEARKEAE